jgi:hypothetical protein
MILANTTNEHGESSTVPPAASLYSEHGTIATNAPLSYPTKISGRPLLAQCGQSTKARRMLSAKKTTFGWNRLLPTASFWD